ncbi:MAG TPA: hypothetical protein VMI54_13445 [Polyangiaceae bacterium]|nr:hypothetical protein [Polyangiaceae bacterium]
MRSLSIALPFGVLAFAAGCTSGFTELGDGTDHGGMGAAAGMAGTGASGTAGLGAGGSGASGGTDASGGTGADGGKGGTTGTGGSDATGGSSGKGGKGGKGGTGGSGASGGTTSTGGGAGMAGSSGSAGSGGYDPCGGKTCGDGCALCDPAASGCISDNLARFCDASGTCSAVKPTCGAECKVDGDCAVPDLCQACPDGSSACATAHCVDGTCETTAGSCPDQACQGKTCGDECQPSCTGGPGVCVAPLAYCDANETCQIGSKPTCPACSADSDCGSGHVCVDQVGGVANGGGFECAVQLPCGSSDPCACIQNEGTCTYVDGSPGYCQCDNGIR